MFISALDSLEKSLRDLYKDAPALPHSAKKVLVEWLPWINLVFGLLAILSAYSLWHWARVADNLVNSVNSLVQPYVAAPDRFSIMVWLGIILLLIQGVIMVAAYSPLKARQKPGWDLLFYAVLINILYGVAVAFTDYGASHLVGSLIAAVVALYFLFQIRPFYVKKSSPVKKRT
jgi:hypothetical protein